MRELKQRFLFLKGERFLFLYELGRPRLCGKTPQVTRAHFFEIRGGNLTSQEQLFGSPRDYFDFLVLLLSVIRNFDSMGNFQIPSNKR